MSEFQRAYRRVSRGAVYVVPLLCLFVASILFAPISSALSQPTSQDFSRNLHIGEAGSDVYLLQTFLISKGFLSISSPTDYFGVHTQAALKEWQASVGLPNTGYFGLLSRADIGKNSSVSQNSKPGTTSTSTPKSPVTNPISVAKPPILTTNTATTSVQTPAAPIPIVSILGVADNASVSGVLDLSATTMSSESVVKVAFYLNNVLQATDVGPPDIWNWNTAFSGNGSYTIVAKAYDAEGGVGISKTITVTVDNPQGLYSGRSVGGGGGGSAPPPVSLTPTIPLNLTVATTTTSTATLSWTASTESGGNVAGYAIYRNSIEVGDSIIPSFTDTGLTSSTTYSYSVEAFDSNGDYSANSNTVSATTPLYLNYAFGMAISTNLEGVNNGTFRNAALADMASMGVGWLRFDVQWNNVQSVNATTYNWADIDVLVNAAEAYHFKMLGILDYSPAWAATSTCTAAPRFCAPANPAQYATYAAAAATHYAPMGVHAWEIWNEPNLASNWGPAANGASYEQFLKAAYVAIKAVDPTATVISGGLSPAGTDSQGDVAPVTFLQQMYAAGAQPYMDGVGFHPYSFPAMPLNYFGWNAWSQMYSTTPSIRSVMIANGDANKPVWMTEVGAPTNGPGKLESSATDTTFAGSPDHVTEALQALTMSEMMTTAESMPWAGPLLWYSYKDDGTSTSTIENFFGVVRADGSDKPAYYTYKSIADPNQ